jgi:hypothetical protein
VFIALSEQYLVHRFKKTKVAAKSHTHLQFTPATTLPKIAKEYVFANAENQAEWNKTSG